LLSAASQRIGGFAEESVLELAEHLGTPERAAALYILSVADDDLDPAQRARLDVLFDLVQNALRHPELTSRDARNLVQQRRLSAMRLVLPGSPAAARIEAAPRAYLLRQDAPTVASHAALIDPTPGRAAVKVATTRTLDGWRVDVVARDQPGLLAKVTGGLADVHLDIADADVVTWPDGTALESFGVGSHLLPTADVIADAVTNSLRSDRATPGVVGVHVEYDDDASPWHTLCETRAPDRPGLLHSIAAAFAAVGVNVHTARATTDGDVVCDVFAVTDRHGSKLDQRTKAAIEEALRVGVRPGRQRFRRQPHTVGTSTKHTSHSVETVTP
jgi:[protein-PII] uridylyltransferase